MIQPAPAPAADNGELDALVANFARILGAELALLCLREPGRRAEVTASFGLARPLTIELPRRAGERRTGGCSRPVGGRGGFAGRVLAHGQPTFEALDPGRDAELTAATHAPLTHALSVPVRVPGGGAGALIAGLPAHPDDVDGAFGIAESYAVLVGLLAEHPAALRGLLEVPRLDSLTGCLTYESTCHELLREIRRAERAGLRLSCLFIDLDRSNQFSDLHGHLRGDEILAEVAGVLREGVRSCDILGRVGGDRFLAILPDTIESGAHTLAERLECRIRARHADRFSEPVTTSINVQAWSAGRSAAELFAAGQRSPSAAGVLDAGRTVQLAPARSARARRRLGDRPSSRRPRESACCVGDPPADAAADAAPVVLWVPEDTATHEHVVSIPQLLDELREFGSASLELVAWDLCIDEEQLKPIWARAVRAGQIAPIGRSEGGEVMYSLVDPSP